MVWIHLKYFYLTLFPSPSATQGTVNMRRRGGGVREEVRRPSLSFLINETGMSFLGVYGWQGWSLGCDVGEGLGRMLGQNSAATPTILHRLLSNLRLFLTFRFGDHHGREGGDKAVAE